MTAADLKKVVTFRYTNYKGETEPRRVIPRELRFASTEWHPEEQWVLEAFDLDRNAERSFAIKDIIEWNLPAASPRDCCQPS
jgi:predicted DNA-binding transcriptional regulator YafY